jgi:hypothetical protein
MMVGLPWWVLVGVVVVAMLAFGLALVVLRRCGLAMVLGLALVWCLLAALPAMAVLPFSYVTVSQRLLYWMAAPSAVLWATVCVAAAATVRRLTGQAAVGLAVATMVLLPSGWYVCREVSLHKLALSPLRRYATIARQFSDERHLVVNAVDWVNYKEPWYALGHEGVAVSADYIDFGQLVRLNSGTHTRFEAVTFPEIRSELDRLYYATIGEDRPWHSETLAAEAPAFDRVWLTTYAEEGIRVEEVGSVRDGPVAVPSRYQARFGEQIYLVQSQFRVIRERAIVILDWKCLDDLPDVTVFRHLVDCVGNPLAQGDGLPLGRMLPFSQLAPGSEVHDVRPIRLGDVPEDGCFKVGVGLFRDDGTRLEAAAPDGAVIEEGALWLDEQGG